MLSAVRIGLGRGRTEFRHMLTTPIEHMFNIFVAVIILTVLYFQRDNTAGGTDLGATDLWVLALGLLATVPAGMVFRALARNPRVVVQTVGLGAAPG